MLTPLHTPEPQAHILLCVHFHVAAEPRRSWNLTPAALMDAISIFHGGGALKSTGPGSAGSPSFHYSLPSPVTALICVDKGLDGRLWFRQFGSRSTIFTTSAGPRRSRNDINPPFFFPPFFHSRAAREPAEADLFLNLRPAHDIRACVSHADSDRNKVPPGGKPLSFLETSGKFEMFAQQKGETVTGKRKELCQQQALLLCPVGRFYLFTSLVQSLQVYTSRKSQWSADSWTTMLIIISIKIK